MGLEDSNGSQGVSLRGVDTRPHRTRGKLAATLKGEETEAVNVNRLRNV